MVFLTNETIVMEKSNINMATTSTIIIVGDIIEI